MPQSSQGTTIGLNYVKRRVMMFSRDSRDSREQGAEENIWTIEGWSDGRVEKTA
jgi:hypothetical protein